MEVSNGNCYIYPLIVDLVQKLIDNGKHLLAVKYVFELQLTSKYPPVPILETYVKESNKIAMKICEDGKNSLKSQVILLTFCVFFRILFRA